MDSPSDAEVIGRSVAEPEAFRLVYDRHAATASLRLRLTVFAGVFERVGGAL